LIRLEVEDYCASCLDFSPDVSKPDRYFIGNNELVMSDTLIRCKYRKRCAGIRRFLDQQMKEEETNAKS
jgi:hypothetical protein